jgi:SAM-dependent methyltransferase
MRKYMPLLYDKHSLERGQKVSNQYRNEHNIDDPCYAYGEIEIEIFATMYLKVCTGFGIRSTAGVFYDLGCGVGSLVYAAAFVGQFSRCCGVEYIEPLLDRGQKRMVRWNKYKTEMPTHYADITFGWTSADFLEAVTWIDATFIFLHWTAFSLPQRMLLADHLLKCAEGTFVISLTHAVPSNEFIVLVKDECTTSWGITDFYVQEKITPRRRIDLEDEVRQVPTQ